ncbi:MAG TPA: VC0807 family protein [Ktedonobacteraceae bacterium]
MTQSSHVPSTSPGASKQPGSPRNLNLSGLFLTAIVDGGLAYVIYILLIPHFPQNSIYPLLFASLAPLLGNIYSLIRNRRLDFLGILVLLGIAFSLITALVTGDPKLLLIRESFITGGYGLACFVSLLFFPRPLMFVLMRHFITGNDPERIRSFNARWNSPAFRRFQRIVTFVWGVGLVGEFIIRLVMIYMLPVAQVLAIAPIVLTAITVLLILWTIRYGRQNARPGGALSRTSSEEALPEPAS